MAPGDAILKALEVNGTLYLWRRFQGPRRGWRDHLPFVGSLTLLVLLPWLGGCGHLRPKPHVETVYVMAKQTFLRDRVAAVSNRVGTVSNGQALRVLEHGRRFLKVQTEKGEVGWVEERAVITEDTYNQFGELQKQHAHDPVVSTAVLRDDLYLHLKPGRETERFYLLPENDKLQMLVRASVAKPTPPQGWPVQPVPRAEKAVGKSGKAGKSAKPDEAEAAPAVPLEDWWLVRDTQGRVGWMLSRRLDIDVPDAIAGYSEGQKLVGAYVLTHFEDRESDAPDKQVPVFVAVLNAYKDGLPYDFDQVRVFTWNVKKHRYETAFRQRGLHGYLPVVVTRKPFENLGEQPFFEFRQAVGEGVTTDPQTGATRPSQTELWQYRLEGVQVKKVLPAPPPPPPRPARVEAPRRAARTRSAPRHRHRH